MAVVVSIYNLGGKVSTKIAKRYPALAGRGSVCPACDARNDRRKIGGELSVENDAGQSSPEVRSLAVTGLARHVAF